MPRYCSSCGKETVEGIKFCPSCGKPVLSEAPSPIQSQVVQTQTQIKSPGIAALLSFLISGAGQIYNGQVGTGIFCFICVTLLFFMGLWAIGSFNSFVIMAIAVVLWIFLIYDAYTTAQKINRGEIKV